MNMDMQELKYVAIFWNKHFQHIEKLVTWLKWSCVTFDIDLKTFKHVVNKRNLHRFVNIFGTLHTVITHELYLESS